jgi:hypothetical protein
VLRLSILISIFATILSTQAFAANEFTSMTCESGELLVETAVPTVSVVAPKIYSNHIPVLLFTVRTSPSDFPTGFECRVARITHRASEQMNISCVAQNDQNELLSIHTSRNQGGFVANLRHKKNGAEAHEINDLECKPYAPRVTRPY